LQELTLPGRLETERLVGTQCVVIAIQHPEQQIGHPRVALDLGQSV
jgi:hypothetical protein